MTTPTLPGDYIYTDPIGSPPERIKVIVDGEQLAARFDGDEGPCLVAVADMSGEFKPANVQ
jgi:hypothetical protein